MFESVYFSNEDSKLNGSLIKNLRKETGRLLAKKINSDEIDLVVPVPDTGKPAARQLAVELGLPYVEAVIKNKTICRTFILPSHQIRNDAIKTKFSLKKNLITGKRVGLVDDSLIRGTTAKLLVKMLKKAGATKVVFISACPKVKYPCFYGINMSTKKELIGSRRTTWRIQSLIGADRLVYLPVWDLKKALGLDICTACLTKDYPVKISLYEKISLAHQRAMQDRAYSLKYAHVLDALGKLQTKGIRQIKATLHKTGVVEMMPYLRLFYDFLKKGK